MVWVAVGTVLGALLLAAVVVYNRLIRAKVAVRNAWAQVDTQLQRRHDLIPNLVATVQAYTDHERGVLDAVTQARATALTIRDPLDREVAEDHLGVAVARLLAVSEGYPDLKADGNFRALQEELSATEDRLAFARGFANDRVARYREMTDTLPGLLIARPFGMPRGELFALEEERARRRPDVTFDDAQPDPGQPGGDHDGAGGGGPDVADEHGSGGGQG
jgi:LemA protein